MKIAKIVGACALAVLSAAASAQAWPEKRVTLVVPYPAGGGVDPVARLLGQKLAERWKQPVIVENRAGGSGTIGASSVARAAPDGHTILISAAPEVVVNHHFMKLTYNPETDLKPVTMAVRLPFILVASRSQPFSTLPEMIAYAKKNPGKLTYASSGAGTLQHLAAAMVENMAGIKMVHIPYKGVAPAVSDLLAGVVDVGFAGLPTGLPHAKAGTLKALAVSSKTPAPAAPEVPTVAATLKEFDLIQFFGVFVPGGTPDAVVQKLQADFADVLASPEVKTALEKQGATPSGMPTAEFQAFLKAERQKYGEVVKNANIQQQ